MSLVPKYIKNLSPYIPGKRIEDVQSYSNSKTIIKLSSNENPAGPSIKAINAVQNSLNNMNRYPDSSGHDLRLLLADKYNLDINNVILGCGSEGIMSTIIRTFLHEDDELISSEDSFIGFRVLANASGRKVNWVKMKNYSYDLNAISKKINDKTKIIYLANPDNPTGTYFKKNDFDNFISKVPSRVLVILDEAYYEYAEHLSDYPNSMIYRYDNVITLRTFSKCYGLAGFRIGYGFAHKSLIQNLMKVKLPFEPSIPAQVAALASINDNQYLQRTLDENFKGKEYLTQELDRMNIKYIPSVTNFVTVVFESENIAIDFIDKMLKNGVIVRGLASFGLDNCVRITIGSGPEIKYFVKILNKIIK